MQHGGNLSLRGHAVKDRNKFSVISLFKFIYQKTNPAHLLVREVCRNQPLEKWVISTKNEKNAKEKTGRKGQLWRFSSGAAERDVALAFFKIRQRDMAVAIG